MTPKASVTWRGEEPPVLPAIGWCGWGRVVVRGAAVLGVLYGGLALLLGLRGVEWICCKGQRRWSGALPQRACRMALALMGFRYHIRGQVASGQVAEVANHAGWLDILTLNACQRVTFVSKAEVARWPGIGWLARATGTLFIRRDPQQSRAQQTLISDHLGQGARLVFFPEGTSSDGRRVLPFKSTLFAAFFAPELRETMQVQPVTVLYHPAPGQDPRFYGWWGDMALGPHLAQVLAAHPQGEIEVVFHPPLRVAEFASRKDLAAACEAAVRSAMPAQAPETGFKAGSKTGSKTGAGTDL